MDLQYYAMRQSQKDRLEDVGVIKYQRDFGFDTPKSAHNKRFTLVYRLRLVLNTLITLFVK